MEIGQDDRKVPQGTGRRTIGEVAGHKINLEIEGIQDKIKFGEAIFNVNLMNFYW